MFDGGKNVMRRGGKEGVEKDEDVVSVRMDVTAA